MDGVPMPQRDRAIMFHHLFSKYNELTLCKIFKLLMKKRGNNIIIAVVTTGILILGQHSLSVLPRLRKKALVKEYLKWQTFLCSD